MIMLFLSFIVPKVMLILIVLGAGNFVISFLYLNFVVVPKFVRVEPTIVEPPKNSFEDSLQDDEDFFSFEPASIRVCREFNRSCDGENTSVYLPYDLPLPSKKDWRDYKVIGPVYDQKMCNACWAFAVAGAIESAVAITYKNNTTNNLSVQQLIDCTAAGGCKYNSVASPLKYLCESTGPKGREKNILTTEYLYPLTLGRKDRCKCGKELCHQGVKLKHFNIICDVPEKEILNIVANYGPVIAYVDAMTWVYYTPGDVIQYNCQSYTNHIVQIIGYDLTADPPFYIIKNSWGTDFGDDGFLRVAYGKRLCGIGSQIAYVKV